MIKEFNIACGELHIKEYYGEWPVIRPQWIQIGIKSARFIIEKLLSVKLNSIVQGVYDYRSGSL
jgi:hypothetical protein